MSFASFILTLFLFLFATILHFLVFSAEFCVIKFRNRMSFTFFLSFSFVFEFTEREFLIFTAGFRRFLEVFSLSTIFFIMIKVFFVSTSFSRIFFLFSFLR